MMHLESSAGGVWATVLACVVLAAPGRSVSAHETDQFSMPPYGQAEFAEMGGYYNDYFLSRVEAGVARANAMIKAALHNDKAVLTVRKRPAGSGNIRRNMHRSPVGANRTVRLDPQDVLDDYQSPRGLARSVRRAFPNAVDLIEDLERHFRNSRVRQHYAPAIPCYFAPYTDSIYTDIYFVADPRTVFRIWRASTMMTYGHYVGNDKWGHFVDMGYHYYTTYHRERDRGRDESDALAVVLEFATKDPVYSESGLLGNVTASAYSNADLASNYVGFLFYRNLTEPVALNGQRQPPMIVRDGPYWRIADHVRRTPDFFRRFVCDHFNEALNPSLFTPDVRGHVRRKISQRRGNLLQWYAPMIGSQDPADFFEHKTNELSTYFGQDYGHSGDFDNIIHLGNAVADQR